MRVLTFTCSFHYEVDFVLDVFYLCFKFTLHCLYPALCPVGWWIGSLVLWPLVGLVHLGEWEESRREKTRVRCLHFPDSHPVGCCRLTPSPYGGPQPPPWLSPSVLWHILGVPAPSCGIGDGPTVTSCYYSSIPSALFPIPDNNFPIKSP